MPMPGLDNFPLTVAHAENGRAFRIMTAQERKGSWRNRIDGIQVASSHTQIGSASRHVQASARNDFHHLGVGREALLQRVTAAFRRGPASGVSEGCIEVDSR